MQPLWGTIWEFICELNIELPHNPAILLLGIYAGKTPQFEKIHVLQCSFTAVFIKAKI